MADDHADDHARDVHGPSLPAGGAHEQADVDPPGTLPVPGWVDSAVPVRQHAVGDLFADVRVPGSEDTGFPPYVARDVDPQLDSLLATAAAAPRGELVLVAGPPNVGKTRPLAAALGRVLPDRVLLAPPRGTDLRPLPAWLNARAERAPRGWVIWLDDLDHHLASELPQTLVAALGAADAVVAATIRRDRLEDLRPGDVDEDRPRLWTGFSALDVAPVVVARRWSPWERERARASGDERLAEAVTAADERFGVTERLAAGPVLEPIWSGGPDNGHPRGYALVAAAVVLARIGVSGPLTREEIEAAHTAYLPDPPPLLEDADQAWAWATRRRDGLPGLLVPAGRQGRWRAFGSLTLRGMPPEGVWRTALDLATERERITVGVTALSARRFDIAEAALEPLARQGDLEAMYHYADLTSQRGTGKWKWMAQEWFEKAAERGHVDAMVELGRLLWLEEGLESWAEEWYRKAADHGHPDAVCALATLLSEEPGREEEAEECYRRAIDQGDPDAMQGLGYHLRDAGREEEAETWFLRAAEQGLSDAMEQLAGMLAKKPGREQEAATWNRRARAQHAAMRERFADAEWWLEPGSWK